MPNEKRPVQPDEVPTYDLSDPDQQDLLLRRVTGFLRVSVTDGTDREGRAAALLSMPALAGLLPALRDQHDLYHAAQGCILAGDLARHEGRFLDAAAHYDRAAWAYDEFADTRRPEQVRTRQVFADGASALRCRSQEMRYRGTPALGDLRGAIDALDAASEPGERTRDGMVSLETALEHRGGLLALLAALECAEQVRVTFGPDFLIVSQPGMAPLMFSLVGPAPPDAAEEAPGFTYRLLGVTPERACRVCGCTDEQGCPEGCTWVEEDLCSRCLDELVASEEERLPAAEDGVTKIPVDLLTELRAQGLPVELRNVEPGTARHACEEEGVRGPEEGEHES